MPKDEPKAEQGPHNYMLAEVQDHRLLWFHTLLSWSLGGNS